MFNTSDNVYTQVKLFWFSLSDEEKVNILSKFVDEDKGHEAVYNDVLLDEEFVEVLPESWLLEDHDSNGTTLKKLFH